MSNISSISPLFLCALSLSAFIGLVEGQIEMTKQTMGEERGGSCEKVPPFNYLHTHSFIHSFIYSGSLLPVHESYCGATSERVEK
mmetsp:Transcript_31216/g.61604  ORF Transcript_31216/g.61604 Transcript_31216/m.61604 type:complete len:85 (-) Transcript_31216:1267-1521(-)